MYVWKVGVQVVDFKSATWIIESEALTEAFIPTSDSQSQILGFRCSFNIGLTHKIRLTHKLCEFVYETLAGSVYRVSHSRLYIFNLLLSIEKEPLGKMSIVQIDPEKGAFSNQ